MSLWSLIGWAFVFALIAGLLLIAVARWVVIGLPGLRRESAAIEDQHCGDAGGYGGYGLKRPDCDRPGRVEVLRRAGDR